MIPARYQASRFPAKLMQDLNGKPVIVRTYEAAVNTGLFDEVYVVTDSDLIFDVISEIGGKVLKSRNEHESGSDRIAEAVEDLEVDIVINVQGDEPLIPIENIEQVAKLLDIKKEAVVATLCEQMSTAEEVYNSNNVKVVFDKQEAHKDLLSN